MYVSVCLLLFSIFNFWYKQWVVFIRLCSNPCWTFSDWHHLNYTKTSRINKTTKIRPLKLQVQLTFWVTWRGKFYIYMSEIFIQVETVFSSNTDTMPWVVPSLAASVYFYAITFFIVYHPSMPKVSLLI